jgi:hypothetical protein
MCIVLMRSLCYVMCAVNTAVISTIDVNCADADAVAVFMFVLLLILIIIDTTTVG